MNTQQFSVALTKKGMTMQIRIRGNKTEFLRAVYDATVKRTRQKLIKEDEFTNEEQQQYEEYKAKSALKSREITLKYAAMGATRQIDDLAESLENGHTVKEPEALLAALDRLNLALRKQGIKRPPKVKNPVTA